MKVILYMTMTANGYIAGVNDETPWSGEAWQSYAEMVTRTKNIIVGRKTFEIMKEEDEFQKIGNPFVVVVSSHQTEEKGFSFAKNPINALSIMQKQGFEEVLIIGGAEVNSSFMKECLISEIYLDIEPLLFGRGKTLFAAGEFEEKLELLGVKHLSKNTVQLHYKII